MVNWYPIVGKLSFGSWGVAHFDPYLTAGYGQMELSNGTSPSKTLGLGLGFWVTPRWTARFEYRAEQYTAEYYDHTEDMNTSVTSMQVGWML
jgi:outer membrane beta-barrel protein